MESSKLMAFSASRDASTSSTADFLRTDSGSNARDDLERNAYAERSSDPDQGHRPAVEAESSSSTLLNAEITLLDAAGAVTPISDGEREPLRMARRTVDDVWREIVAGKKSEKQPKEEMMTLEDFLAKADLAEEKKAVNEETRSTVEVKEEGLSGGIYSYESGSSVMGSGAGLGLDFVGIGRGKGRSLSLLEPLDRAAQQRQKRMIKNRESAARSRERKQAYQVELESMAVRLVEENEQLLKEKEEWTKKRLKQLMENVIPVVEKRKPRQLKKVRSMQW